MPFVTTYQPLPVAFTHGQGVWLYDENNRPYLDGLSGIAVCGLGHAHPDVTHTIATQAAKLLHTSNGYRILAQEALAQKLSSLTGMSQAFFSNSGAEANETAIKLTRLWGHKKGIANPQIIVMEHAFHGRTMATLTATANPKAHEGFEPLVEGFVRAPFNDLKAIEHLAKTHPNIVAVMLEPIQGEGGIFCADKAYLQGLEKLCQHHDWLFILDEIQTGNGRTGSLFAYEQYEVMPDVLTTAKGLGNGMPIGATLMRGKACDLFKPGSHGSTFGGNPLACETALTVLNVLARDKLCEHAKHVGDFLKEQLRQDLKDIPNLKEVRGLGLMIGIEFDTPIASMRALGLEEGVLFNVTADKVLRLLPPLIMTKEEALELSKRISKTVHRFFNYC